MSRYSFSKTAYESCDELVFANAKYPITLKNGIAIGGGTIYPEINLTV